MANGLLEWEGKLIGGSGLLEWEGELINGWFVVCMGNGMEDRSMVAHGKVNG
jgi:hypothetical protein